VAQEAPELSKEPVGAENAPGDSIAEVSEGTVTNTAVAQPTTVITPNTRQIVYALALKFNMHERAVAKMLLNINRDDLRGMLQ
jgi:hypothetical protein